MQQPSNIKENHNLKRASSWRTGGVAKYFAQPSNIEEIKKLFLWANFCNLDIFILADGTNLLISDQLIEALVVDLKKMRSSADTVKQIKEASDTQLLSFSLLAGTPKNDLFLICLNHQLSASVFLAGLPGSLGGGVVMNAGVGFDCQPKEFKDIVSWVQVLSFDKKNNSFSLKKYNNKELKWDYRFCDQWKASKESVDIITEVGFCFSLTEDKQDSDILLKQVTKAKVFRKTKQPINTFNCGSVFKNPKGFSAGALIDQCGLKLESINGASVSGLHANFIIAKKDTKSQDIFNLIKKIKNTVLEKKNIQLQLEVRLMGEF